MIYEALSCIVTEINAHLKSTLNLTEDLVLLSSLVNQDGSIAIQGENKLVLTLINIEKETATSTFQRYSNLPQSSARPLHINIYFLCSAYFSSNNYPEALRFISFIIGYFQQKSVFDNSNTPTLDNRIDKLTVELTEISLDKLSNIWAVLGTKYMPSVLYKLRMLVFDESIVKEFRPNISAVTNTNSVAQ